MSLAPRSLVHAINQHFRGPSLRVRRTEAGGRALRYEAPEAAPDSAMPGPEAAPAAVPTPGRFIDNDREVGFRSGLLRSARENYDVFEAPADRAETLGRLGPVETSDNVASLRLTPETRQRINRGEVNPQPAPRPRLMFGAADGEGMPALEGQFRTNDKGWLHLQPFKERWGDNRFDPEERKRSLAVLEEIEGLGAEFWRTAPWEKVRQAVNDIEEITANLYFYAPDFAANPQERIRRYAEFTGRTEEEARRAVFGGAAPQYLEWRARRDNEMEPRALFAPFNDERLDPRRDDYVYRSTPVGRYVESPPEDLREFATAGRRAVETLLRTRRAGVRRLLDGFKVGEDPNAAPATLPPDRMGRFSALRRAVEELGDEWFADVDGEGGRPGYQLLNAIRKGRNVAGNEVEQTELAQLLAKRDEPIDRDSVLSWLDQRELRMNLLQNKYDPARPTKDYAYGNTRAFDGPRVPGYGRYFERRFQWPARLGVKRKGAPVGAAQLESGHWEDGVWGSIRGSVREAGAFGKGVLGEELQRDQYQAINKGARIEVSDAEFQRQREAREARERLNRTATAALVEVRRSLQGAAHSTDPAVTRFAEISGAGLEPLDVDRWNAMLALWRESEALQRLLPSWNIADGLRAAEAAPPPDKRVLSPQLRLTDSQSTRFLVRDLFMVNAKEGGAWVAIPTGALNDRIQRNTYNSAAHYYDGTLRNVLGKVARDIDPSLTVERVTLPTPPLKRGVPVYMVKGITPEINAKLQREGMPRYGMAQRAESEPPMTAARWRDEVEAMMRADARWGKAAADLLDTGRLHLIPDGDSLPAHIVEAAAEQGGIPAWVGAINDAVTGETYFITDRLPEHQLMPLMLHEVGVHAGLQAMLGKRRHTNFLEHVRQRLVQEEKRFAEGVAAGKFDAADRDVHPWLGSYAKVARYYAQPGQTIDSPAKLTLDQLEEVAAHMAEFFESAVEQVGARDLESLRADRTWWQNFLDDVKRWAITALGWKGEMTARDVHYMAVGALRRQARKARAEQAPTPYVAVPEERFLAYARARGFEGTDPREAADWLDAQGYFSPALDAVRRYPQEIAERAQMVGWLKNQPGVKQDELNTLFLDEFVAIGAKATRFEFQDWVAAHRFETTFDFASTEGARSGGSAKPQWGAYTYLSKVSEEVVDGRNQHAPDGYFEMVIRPTGFDDAAGFRGFSAPTAHQMPGEHWRGGHFGGGLAHVRGVRDTPVDGKSATLLVEIQSDMFDAKDGDFVDISTIRRELQREYDDAVARYLPLAQQVDPNQRRDFRGVAATRINVTADRLNNFDRTQWTMTRDRRAPYRNSWPEKAFADAVRQSIRDGAKRIAWSTGDAVRQIPGMTTYKGDLYDARIPRLAKKWLGVEVRKGAVDGANSGGGASSFEQREAAVFLAMYETRADVGPLRATNELDVLHEAMEDLARSRFAFFEETANNPDMRDEVAERFLAEIQDYSWRGAMRAPAARVFDETLEPHRAELLTYIRAQLDRAFDAVDALDGDVPNAVQAHYFDVTPEVRAAALAPRSLFFGVAERIPPGFVDAQGRSVFGSRTPVLDKIADGDAPDYRRTPATQNDVNTAIGSAVAGAPLLAATGAATAVMSNEQERGERLAEFQRLEAERRASEANAERTRALRAEREARAAAIAARDLSALPTMDTSTFETRQAWLSEAVTWGEEWTGVSSDYLYALIARETAYTLQPNIRPIRDGEQLSGAMGLGQFIPETWAAEIKRVGAEYGFNVGRRSLRDLRSDEAIQELRANPTLAVAITAAHQLENVRQLEASEGRPVTAAEAYAAHFLGLAGARKFLQGVEEDWSAARFERAFPAQVRANPFLEGLSARQIMAQFREEFPGSPYRVRPSADEGAGPAAGADE